MIGQQSLTAVGEKRTERVGVGRLAIELAEWPHRLLHSALHHRTEHRLPGAAVAAAEKEGAGVVMLRQKPEAAALRKVDGGMQQGPPEAMRSVHPHAKSDLSLSCLIRSSKRPAI